MNDITLESLVGEHVLTGVDFENVLGGYHIDENCQVINFTLDGHTYTACEDPEDDYRSSMEYLRSTDTPTKNVFSPCRVLARMQENNEILELVDANTNLVVLAVGTDISDDYYPCFIANFLPENMAINKRNEL